MESWLLLTSVAFGTLMLLDPLIYAYIAYSLDVSSIYLGVCSALWSICYIVSSIAFGALGDLGKSKLLTVLSGIAMTVSCILFLRLDLYTALLSYSLHAVSIALLNLAISALIFDVVDSDQWNKTVLTFRFLSQVTRGVFLVLISLTGFLNITLVQQSVIVLIFLSIVLMPPQIISERSIYKMGSMLRGISSYLKASTSILYIDKPETAQIVFERMWDFHPRRSLWKIAIVIMLTACIGDYIFTILPLLVKNSINLKTLYLAYGITSLASILVIPIGRVNYDDKRLTSMLMALRSLIFISGIFALKDALALALYVLTTSILYLAIDAMLYNSFILSTGGYRSSVYYSLRELGSVFGALLGGIMMSLGLNAFLCMAMLLSIACITVNLS